MNSLASRANTLSIISNSIFHNLMPINVIACRTKYYKNRHRHQEYRKERAKKVWKIELPNFDEFNKDSEGMDPEAYRSKMKEKGIVPPTPWNERALYQNCTLGILEPYVADKDESVSSITGKLTSLPGMAKDYYKFKKNLGELKEYEGEDFSIDVFAEQATGIYIKAHQLLIERNNDAIFDYVTEHCYPTMSNLLKSSSLDWTYLGNVEQPRIVQIRSGSLGNKANKFAQITVRFHSKQIVAIYDRHGRLMHGSPTDVREILEYIVFEKYLANEYGKWRMHAKISGAPKSEQSKFSTTEKTYMIQAQ